MNIFKNPHVSEDFQCTIETVAFCGDFCTSIVAFAPDDFAIAIFTSSASRCARYFDLMLRPIASQYELIISFSVFDSLHTDKKTNKQTKMEQTQYLLFPSYT